MIDFQTYKERHMSAAALSVPTGAERPFLGLYHDVLEEVQPVLSGNEFTVFVAIFRKTEGFHKASEFISYPYLAARTGIKHLDTIARIVRRLIERGFITLCEGTDLHGAKQYAISDHLMTPPEIRGVPPQKLGGSKKKKKAQKTPPEIRGVPPQKLGGYPYNDEGGTPPEIRGQPLDQPSPEEAPRDPKETLKERDKETSKERALVQASDVQIESKKGEEEKMIHNPHLDSIWSVVRSELQVANTPATFDNWLAPLKVAGAEGAILYLQASTSFNAQMFQQRFAQQASGILSRMIHEEAEVRCLPPNAGRSSA